MTNSQRPLWKEGMLLLQHNLQQWDAHWEEVVNIRHSWVNPYAWGFERLQLDEPSLAMDVVSIREAVGVFQEGTAFMIQDRDDPPKERSLQGLFPSGVTARKVYLGLYRERPKRPSVRTAEQESAIETRYGEYQTRVCDRTTGEDEREISVARPVFRLLVGDEDRSQYDTLPLGVIENTGAGLRVADTFVPPLLRYDVSAVLSARVSRLLANMVGVVRGLREASHRIFHDASSITGKELRRTLRHLVVETHLPTAQHLEDSSLTHPYELYRWLLMLDGALALSAGTMPHEGGVSYKSYDHSDCLAAIGPVMESISLRLRAQEPLHCAELAISAREGGYFETSLKDIEWIHTASIFVRVQSDVNEQETIGGFEKASKVASGTDLPLLIGHGLPGVQLKYVPLPPNALPRSTGDVYFEVVRQGDVWARLLEHGRLAIWVQLDKFPNLSLGVWAIAEKGS